MDAFIRCILAHTQTAPDPLEPCVWVTIYFLKFINPLNYHHSQDKRQLPVGGGANGRMKYTYNSASFWGDRRFLNLSKMSFKRFYEHKAEWCWCPELMGLSLFHINCKNKCRCTNHICCALCSVQNFFIVLDFIYKAAQSLKKNLTKEDSS